MESENIFKKYVEAVARLNLAENSGKLNVLRFEIRRYSIFIELFINDSNKSSEDRWKTLLLTMNSDIYPDHAVSITEAYEKLITFINAHA